MTKTIKVHIVRRVDNLILMKVSMPAGAIPHNGNSVRLYIDMEDGKDVAFVVQQVRYSFKNRKLILVEVLV